MFLRLEVVLRGFSSHGGQRMISVMLICTVRGTTILLFVRSFYTEYNRVHKLNSGALIAVHARLPENLVEVFL